MSLCYASQVWPSLIKLDVRPACMPSGNGLDLRPATAAPEGLLSQHVNMNDNAGSTREVDLGSLPAALFHPRGEETVPRPSGEPATRAQLLTPCHASDRRCMRFWIHVQTRQPLACLADAL